jgi:hypothetical protein
VLAWAVLGGLFFMHGAGTAWTGGCGGGQLAMTASAMTTAAMPDAGSARPATSKVAASPAGAAATWQVAVSASRGSATRAPAHSSDRHCCAMLCTSRLPRQGFLGVPANRPAAAVLVITAALMLLPCFGRASPRPPGRPGLPLPLFLGVSRT